MAIDPSAMINGSASLILETTDQENNQKPNPVIPPPKKLDTVIIDPPKVPTMPRPSSCPVNKVWLPKGQLRLDEWECFDRLHDLYWNGIEQLSGIELFKGRHFPPDYDKAIEHFLGVIRLYPSGYMATYYYLGTAYLWKGELEKAIEAFRLQLKNSPNSYNRYITQRAILSVEAMIREKATQGENPGGRNFIAVQGADFLESLPGR